MKEFVTAVNEQAKAEQEEEPTYPFKVDGVVYRAFKPTESQYAVFVVNTGRHAPDTEKIAGLVDLFFSMLDEPSHHALYRRLADRDDEFGVDMIEKIMKHLISEWSGKASDEQSGSTPSQPQPGPTSTEPSLAST